MIETQSPQTQRSPGRTSKKTRAPDTRQNSSCQHLDVPRSTHHFCSESRPSVHKLNCPSQTSACGSLGRRDLERVRELRLGHRHGPWTVWTSSDGESGHGTQGWGASRNSDSSQQDEETTEEANPDTLILDLQPPHCEKFDL